MNIRKLEDSASAGRQSTLALDFATAALSRGDPAEAERLLRERLARVPSDATALAKLAEITGAQGRIEETTVLLRRAADVHPSLERYLALIRQLQQFGSPEAVIRAIEAAPQALRHSYALRAAEAASLGILGQHERQIAIYDQLARLNPNDALLWKTFGDTLKTVGRVDDAIAAVRQAIRVRPHFGEAYWTLSNFKSFRFSDSDISAMRKALRKKLSAEDALHFHFALGKALEDRKLYQQSFRHYSAGNEIRASSFSPANMFATEFVNNAISTLTPAFFEARSAAGCAKSDPIFVVGLHRSGSTLIEQILATHPLIEGTTEITVMPQLWQRIVRAGLASGRGAFEELARLDADALTAFGEEYLDRTRAFRTTDRPYFVDKLPANWMNLGLIRLALPNAKIIDARRHPMACGFSNFKQNYATGVAFSYSQESIGAFYRDYWRFMTHFDEVQPAAVHRVINERLIDDPEGEIRRMLDFVGVPFDPACLEFHANKRAVRTPSAEQVRQPINRAGVDAWKNYEPWLGPLKAALGPALEHWDD